MSQKNPFIWVPQTDPLVKALEQLKKSVSQDEPEEAQEQLMSQEHLQAATGFLENTETTPHTRADWFILEICERGRDYLPAMERLVTQADKGRELESNANGLQGQTVVAERYLGHFQLGPIVMATVTGKDTDITAPIHPELAKKLDFGDPVYVSMLEGIIDRNDHPHESGEVVTIDSIPTEGNGLLVKHGDHVVLARCTKKLKDSAQCIPGNKVIFDATRRFVIAICPNEPTGEAILADPTNFKVDRSQVGAIKPVVDEILHRVRLYVERPEMVRDFGVRNRSSYLFSGPTGCGKSFHLQLLAKELHDLVEHYTGQRHPRIAMLDASKVWNPYFGSTEQRIADWFYQLEKAGKIDMVGKDGNPIQFPLVVVLEECEALFRSRSGDAGCDSHHLFDRPMSLLLQKIDSLEGALNNPVIWIATTNRPDLADAAALRRIGSRQVHFGTLDQEETVSVLETKVGQRTPIQGMSRSQFISTVADYLFSSDRKQPLIKIKFQNGHDRVINRNQLVTPAMIDEAYSAAVDHCLHHAVDDDGVHGLSHEVIISFFEKHFEGLSRNLGPQTIPDYFPELRRSQITGVVLA